MTAIMTSEAAMQPPVARPLSVAVAIGVLAAAALAGPAALALEEQKGEAAAIEACDKRLCAILVGKSPQGPDLKCALTKTWARSTIKEADSRQLSWGFGDARCSVEINLSRERLVEAMTAERTTFHVGRYTANCVVEQDGKLEKVTAVVAPKIEFRNGKADKVWVRLKSVDGPASVTLTLQTAAQLADTFGIFHRQMIKGINRYVERHCPKILDVAATPSKAKPKDKAKAAN
jgi:hypothetical protein